MAIPRVRKRLQKSTAALLACCLGYAGLGFAAHASEPSDRRDALFHQSLKRPRDVALALAYADACVAMNDYEGAIGALERVLFFAPGDAHIQAQLGFLYYKLNSHQLARQYFDQALAAHDLDEGTRAKIAALGPDIDYANTGSRAFGTLQAGVRYQSNAAFNPDNNLVRLANTDYVFTHPRDRGSDANGFQIVNLGYDRDLGNQRGDTLEVRLSGYATQQIRFSDLNVGLYDVSIGPRMALAPTALPGWTIKPYAVGGQAFVAGARYFASGGVGILADLPVRPGLVLEPGLEVRQLSYNDASVYSSLNSGSTASASLAGTYAFNETFSAVGRLFYVREDSLAAYQTSSSYAEEFALTAAFRAPLPTITVPWSISPYFKMLQTRFDAPNPYIDQATTRRDNEVLGGVLFDTPVSGHFSIVSSVQYAFVSSNIPNYRLHNLSVLTGPTMRF